ncbi:hypothetical protein R6Q57_019380 [Mikania cordata]
MAAQNDVCIMISEDKTKQQDFDYSQRGLWLCCFWTQDGLVSAASLMMGVGAVKHDARAMILTGFTGLVAVAFSMTVDESVSVYSQQDVKVPSCHYSLLLYSRPHG